LCQKKYAGRLWKSDGTAAGMVKDIRRGPDGSYPSYMTEFSGALYFQATGMNGIEEAIYVLQHVEIAG